MAVTQVDPVSSFANLLDCLPTWTDQISGLVAYTNQRHEEFRSEYTRLVHSIKPRRKRTDSMCSIHTNNEEHPPHSTDNSNSMAPTVPEPTQISPFEAGTRHIYAQINKRKRLGTSCRSGASGPLKFRSKQMVVIYYDSRVQDQLETMVKELGSCRNNLRKGKMAYSLAKGLQLPGFRRSPDSRSSSHSGGLATSLKPRSMPKLPQMKDTSPEADVVPTGEAAFMRVDKELESCQNLCETAAHQFLRDGDCRLELDTASETLKRVKELATTIYQTLKAEDEEQQKLDQVDGSEGSMHTVSDSTLVDKPSRENLSLGSKLSPTSSLGPMSNLKDRPVFSSITSAPLLTTEIEVDDDSDASSIEVDMSRFRTNRPRPGIRT